MLNYLQNTSIYIYNLFLSNVNTRHHLSIKQRGSGDLQRPLPRLRRALLDLSSRHHARRSLWPYSRAQFRVPGRHVEPGLCCKWRLHFGYRRWRRSAVYRRRHYHHLEDRRDPPVPGSQPGSRGEHSRRSFCHRNGR